MVAYFDRFNQSWGKNGLLDDPTVSQSDAGFAFIGQAPPTVELFNSMFQWNDLKDNWLYGQISQVILDSGVSPSPDDINQLLNAIRKQQRIRLGGPITLFVDWQSGNDNTGDGSVGAPWRTVNRATYYAQNQIDMNGQTVTVQLARPGNYEPVSVFFPVIGLIVVNGDVGAPRNYLIKNPNGPAVQCGLGGRLWVQGVSLEAIGGDTDYSQVGTGVLAHQGGQLYFADVAFGPCSYCHAYGAYGGQCSVPGANINYSIYGGATYHIFSAASGLANMVRAHVTISNNPEFSQGFAGATVGGYVQVWGTTFVGTTTGPRFSSWANSTINAQDPGLLLLPGSVAGITGLGGIYV